MIQPQDALADLDRRPELGLRFIEQPQAPKRLAERIPDRGLDLGLVGEGRARLVRRPAQHVGHLHPPPVLFGIRRREHVLEERVDGPGDLG